jgi:hypothetical protein
MSRRDEIADVLKEAFNDEDNNISRKYCLNVADSIIALLPKTGMVKVEKCRCKKMTSREGYFCEKCNYTGELVRELTLEEAVELPKMLLEGKAQVIIKWWPSYRSIRESYIELPDGSRIRVKSGPPYS